MLTLRNNKGVGLIEVMIAIVLTTVGIMAILTLQGTGWRTVARSDYMGRASGILSSQMETWQIFVMNACNNVDAIVGPQATITVLVSGQDDAVAGDATYTVTTTITDVTNITGYVTRAWRITVNVTWPNNSKGITESIVVTRQDRYRNPPFPQACPS